MRWACQPKIGYSPGFFFQNSRPHRGKYKKNYIFFCICYEKIKIVKKSPSVHLFSCSNIWEAFYYRPARVCSIQSKKSLVGTPCSMTGRKGNQAQGRPPGWIPSIIIFQFNFPASNTSVGAGYLQDWRATSSRVGLVWVEHGTGLVKKWHELARTQITKPQT